MERKTIFKILLQTIAVFSIGFSLTLWAMWIFTPDLAMQLYQVNGNWNQSFEK